MDVDEADIIDTKTVLLAIAERKSSSEVLENMLSWHDEFDRRWKESGHKQSFHNRQHIEAVHEATQTYLKNSSRDNDPAQLYSSLDEWNKAHPGMEINESELPEVLTWVIYGHDNPNVLANLTFENGEFKPEFNDIYRAKGAEDRGKDFYRTLIENSDLDETKKARYITFAQYAIEQTKYMPAKPEDIDLPLARFMRAMDQVGNDFYSKNENRVPGLLEEAVTENPNSVMFGGPDGYYNFAIRKLPYLIPDPEDQRKLVSDIWHKEIPKEVTGLSSTNIPIADYLKQTPSTNP